MPCRNLAGNPWDEALEAMKEMDRRLPGLESSAFRHEHRYCIGDRRNFAGVRHVFLALRTCFLLLLVVRRINFQQEAALSEGFV